MESVENKFVFIPFLDEIGNDLGRIDSSNLQMLMQKALDTPDCVGFNTLGFLKSKITNLQPSRYFGEHDGIYILRDEYRHSQTKIETWLINPTEGLRKMVDNISLQVNLVPTSSLEKLQNFDKRVIEFGEEAKGIETQKVLPDESHFLSSLLNKDPKIMNPIFLAINPNSIDRVKAIPSFGFSETIVLTPSTFFAIECSSLKQKENINIATIVYTEFDFDFGEKLEKLLDSKIEGVTFLIDHPVNVEETIDVIKKINHPDNVIIISEISNLHADTIKRIEQILESLHTKAYTYIFGSDCVSYSAEK
jgi:hypothetical protein